MMLDVPTPWPASLFEETGPSGSWFVSYQWDPSTPGASAKLDSWVLGVLMRALSGGSV